MVKDTEVGDGMLRIPAVELLRMFLPYDVESMSDGGVYSDGEVVVDDVAWNGISSLLIGRRVIIGAEFDLPSIHHDHVATTDPVHQLTQVLTLVP